MDLPKSFLQSERLSFYSGIILAIAYGFFAYVHLMGFKRTHEWILLLICFSETLTIFFLFIRSNPNSVSVLGFDWIVALGGTFAPLLLRPASWGIAPMGKYVTAVGVIIQIAGLCSLNRSFALVAAKREIKTKGLYRCVRHPLYASYFLILGGYVLANTTIANLSIYIATLALLFIRAFREEEHLSQDIQYREYMQKVNYRIIPYVY